MEMSLEDLTQLVKIINVLKKIVDWKDLVELVSSIQAWVDSAIAKLNSLELDKCELKEQLQLCKRKLNEVKANANALIVSVRSLFEYADLDDSRFEDMKKSIRKKKFKCVKDYLYIMNEYLTKTIDCLEEKFLPSYKEVITLCRKTTRDIESKKVEAKNRKIATRVAGGGAAAVAIAGGGIAASVAIGFFTFGVGTVIGLGITAASVTTAVGAGAATGVATHLLASHFRKLEKAFQGLCTDMSKLNNDVTKFGEVMQNIRAKLNAARDNKDVVESCITRRVEPDNLISVLKILLKGIKEAHSKLTTCTT